MRWLIIAILCVSASANAASFDCKAAKSLRERAICADPELSQADDALARAYSAAQAEASPAYRTELRDAQRLWLRNLDRVCTTRQTDPKNTDLQGCLISAVRGRTEMLSKSVLKIGPYVFTQSWHERVAPDPDNQNSPHWRFGTDETIWPRQESPTDAHASAFNAWVRQKLSLENPGAMDPSLDQSASLVPQAANPTVITLQFDSFFYGHGAAHGNYAQTWLYWLVPQDRELRPDDIFAGQDWALPLARKVAAAFKAQTGEESWAKEEDMAKMVTEPDRWTFTSDGMGFVFQPYDIAPYAAGLIEVKLAWSDVAPWLVQDTKFLDVLRSQ
jgi:uncharacterized protein